LLLLILRFQEKEKHNDKEQGELNGIHAVFIEGVGCFNRAMMSNPLPVRERTVATIGTIRVFLLRFSLWIAAMAIFPARTSKTSVQGVKIWRS